MIALVLACTGEIPSGPLPDMVSIPAGVVRLGRKQTPPVAGFAPPIAPGPPPGGPGDAPRGDPGSMPGPGDAPRGDPGSMPGPGDHPNGGGAAPSDMPGSHIFSGTAARPDLGFNADRALKNVAPFPAPEPLEAQDVTVSPFQIDRTEVTRVAYAKFLADTGYKTPYVDEPWAREEWDWKGEVFPAGTGDHPVVLVSWYDAREYCRWADKRLPTEAEWQLAVLGGRDTELLFPWGNDYDAAKLNHGRIDGDNFDDTDGYKTTSPVGAFPSGNARTGLQDAFGNAWEWVGDMRVDDWNDYLGRREAGQLADPRTSPLGIYAAVRGGAYFFDFRPNPAGERSAFIAELRRKTSGFRCARGGV